MLHYIHQPPLTPSGESAEAPLLILIHGYGADQNDLSSLHSYFPTHHMLSLQAPTALPFGGYAWYGLDFDEKGVRVIDTDEVKVAITLAHQTISQFCADNELSLDSSCLLGFSQGGSVVYGLMMTHPHIYKCGAVLSGYVYRDDAMEYSTDPVAYSSHKLFVGHGGSDPVVPLSLCKQSLAFLDSIPLAYTHKVYDCGHTIHPDALVDILSWL